MGQRRKSTRFVALILASSSKHSSELARPRDELRECPLLRHDFCCVFECADAAADASADAADGETRAEMACVLAPARDRVGGDRSGGGDGGMGELDPKDEKKSELRDGGGEDICTSAGGNGVGRDGGVSQEMGELKMSFLLRSFCDDLARSLRSNAGGAAAADIKTGLGWKRVD